MKPTGTGLLLAILLGTAALQGCEKELPPMPNKPEPTAQSVDPRSKVIGVSPQSPKPETATTTSPTPSTMTKQEESRSMPLPGQANDHSTLTKDASQKAKAAPKK